MKENFVKVSQKVAVQNMPKRLLVDGHFTTSFTANNVKYQVMQPEICFNIDKQVAYHNIKIAFDLNQTPTDIKQRLIDIKNTIIELMCSDKKTALMEKLLRDSINNVDSFKGEFTSRYPAALFLCTLFVLAENEDLSTPWTWEAANKKIEDWSVENLSFYDFFVLALSSSSESQAIINENLGDS